MASDSAWNRLLQLLNSENTGASEGFLSTISTAVNGLIGDYESEGAMHGDDGSARVYFIQFDHPQYEAGDEGEIMMQGGGEGGEEEQSTTANEMPQEGEEMLADTGSSFEQTDEDQAVASLNEILPDSIMSAIRQLFQLPEMRGEGNGPFTRLSNAYQELIVSLATEECMDHKQFVVYVVQCNGYQSEEYVGKHFLVPNPEDPTNFVLATKRIQSLLTRLFLYTCRKRSDKSDIGSLTGIVFILQQLWILLDSRIRRACLLPVIYSSIYARDYLFLPWIIHKEAVKYTELYTEVCLFAAIMAYYDVCYVAFCTFLNDLRRSETMISSATLEQITGTFLGKFVPHMFTEWISYLKDHLRYTPEDIETHLWRSFRCAFSGDTSRKQTRTEGHIKTIDAMQEIMLSVLQRFDMVDDGGDAEFRLSLSMLDTNHFDILSSLRSNYIDSISTAIDWCLGGNGDLGFKMDFRHPEVDNHLMQLILAHVAMSSLGCIHLLERYPELLMAPSGAMTIPMFLKRVAIRSGLIPLLIWLYTKYFDECLSREEVNQLRLDDLLAAANTPFEQMVGTTLLYMFPDRLIDWLQDGVNHFVELLSVSESTHLAATILKSCPRLLPAAVRRMQDRTRERVTIQSPMVAAWLSAECKKYYKRDITSLPPHPSYVVSNEECAGSACLVCLTEDDAPGSQWIKLPCCFVESSPKYYHYSCLSQWLSKQTTCPHCRSPLSIFDIAEFAT
jgi:hypothetical protein